MTKHANRRAMFGGWAQVSRNPKTTAGWTPAEPAALIMAAIKKMAQQRSTTTQAMRTLDAICCIEPFSWTYEDLNARIAAELRLPAHCRFHWFPAGGNSPSDAIHSLTQRISSGEIDSALIVGGESAASRAWARKNCATLSWPIRPKGFDPLRGQESFATPLEALHGVEVPAQTFAMYDNALRQRHGASLEGWRSRQAAILHRNLKVAELNEHAWNRKSYTVDQLAGPSDDNRMVNYPYSKRMMAYPFVDQAAAVLLVSAAKADELGLNPAACPAVLGGAGAHDSWQMIERDSFSSSAALNSVLGHALTLAGLDADHIDGFDLYSCFPSAIAIAEEALKISPIDPRPKTVTGGLAFAGGPGNSYCLHAFSSMCDALVSGRLTAGLVTGVGMSFSKHAATVLSCAPDQSANAAFEVLPEIALSKLGPSAVSTASGGVLETYTIDYDRSGAPELGIGYVRVNANQRTIAMTDDPATLQSWTQFEPINKYVQLCSLEDGRNKILSHAL